VDGDVQKVKEEENRVGREKKRKERREGEKREG
jgi:hypothetical protein